MLHRPRSLGKLGVAQLSVLSEDTRGRTLHPFRRRVSIRRDGMDFVVAFQPEDIIAFRVTHNFPSEKMARPSQRACLVVTESDDVFGLECDNEVHAIAPNGYSPAKRVKSSSARALVKH